MVRNLVLTPFIDLSFAHFMFCGEKINELPSLAAHSRPKRNPDCMVNFSISAPIRLLMDGHR
jgi:hypothetical protein